MALKIKIKNNLFIVAFLIALSSCESDSNSYAQETSSDGIGGSLATFSLAGNYLYTVDNQDLNVFSLIDPSKPVQINNIQIGFEIETLFNNGEYLYIGSQFGMFIYGISNPEQPIYISEAQHFRSCDPVIANENYAFVTLFSENICDGGLNELQIYDITDISNPMLINSRNLIHPKGIGLFENYLFVCDDVIKIFDISDPTQITLANSIDKAVFDVVIYQNKLHAIGDDGLYQYSLNPANIEEITILSSISY